MLASIKSAKASDEVGYLLCHLGILYKQYYRDEPSAVRIWEHVLKLAQHPPNSSNVPSAGLIASRCLAESYFDKALEAEKGSVHQMSYIQMLENLAKGLPSTKVEAVEGSSEWGFTLTRNDTSLVLGHLYQVLGKTSLAKDCFATHVRLAVDLLTDDIIENDAQGYGILSDVFTKAKDDDNAFTALLLAYPRMLYSIDEAVEKESNGIGGIEGDNDDHNSRTDDRHPGYTDCGNSEASSAIEKDDRDGLVYQCDECNREFAKAGDLHTCRLSYDLEFCDECIKLIKEEKTKIMQCHPKHEFFRIPPPPNKPPEGYVRYRDEDIPITTWIEQVRREWGI